MKADLTDGVDDRLKAVRWFVVAVALGQVFALAQRPELEWLPDGKKLVVANRWILDSTNGRYAAISCAPPGCGRGSVVPSFTADGASALVLDGARLATGTLPGPLGPWVPVPRWIRGAEDAPVNVAFWITPTTPFVQQFDPRGKRDPQCRIYDPRSRRWRRPASAGCLSADFSYLARIDDGPGGLLALHSSAEGAFALEIVRYDPAKGQSETKAAPILIEGASAVSVRFSADGRQVHLVTPCQLEGGPKVQCADFERASAWRHYSLPVDGGGTVRLHRADLPAGAALHPLNETFAWVRGDAICVGDPKEATGPHCFSLPERL